jgi:hypothetical protein
MARRYGATSFDGRRRAVPIVTRLILLRSGSVFLSGFDYIDLSMGLLICGSVQWWVFQLSLSRLSDLKTVMTVVRVCGFCAANFQPNPPTHSINTASIIGWETVPFQTLRSPRRAQAVRGAGETRARVVEAQPPRAPLNALPHLSLPEADWPLFSFHRHQRKAARCPLFSVDGFRLRAPHRPRVDADVGGQPRPRQAHLDSSSNDMVSLGEKAWQPPHEGVVQPPTARRRFRYLFLVSLG